MLRFVNGFAFTLGALAAAPNFGPNVYIFDPSMPVSQIQATVDAIATQQVSNEFGTERYALLFKPGTYGSTATPLNFQVGYYTAVAGLGRSPNDVVINGSINVYNRCFTANNCTALANFWRSLSNLTISLSGLSGCPASGDFWAVSHGSPMRRVKILGGNTTFMDYCSAGPQFANGGFVADSQLGFVINGAQQQFLVRNSQIGGWSNAVWNQVFSGVVGAPAQSFPSPAYTTLANSPVTREAPYLFIDGTGQFNVFIPAVQTNSSGTTWGAGPTPGQSLPISDFYIAQPTDSAATINKALKSKNVIFTPGIYQLNQTIQVARPDSVVLGLGFPTLVPQNGIPTMVVENARGMLISGLLFDAGTVNSPVLLQMGTGHPRSDNEASDPSALSDIFFRVGGATPGKATTSLIVNTKNIVLDDIWAWRADSGNGVGWTANTADTGVTINGDNATAYGLFVDHYQKYEVIWNGAGGKDIFFQNEMPYDQPNQAAWMETAGVNGWAAFKVSNTASGFRGYGMQSDCLFTQSIFADHAFEVPATLPAGSLVSLLTVPLSSFGGINNVVNSTGGPTSTVGVPVNVISFP